MSVEKNVARLISSANRALKRSPSFCTCGTCEQAILQADEILRDEPNMDCLMWAMMVGAVIFTRAADEATRRGTGSDIIQATFRQMSHHAHLHGMQPKEAGRHFNEDIQRTPDKDRS